MNIEKYLVLNKYLLSLFGVKDSSLDLTFTCFFNFKGLELLNGGRGNHDS
jgi:hypothetical protein